MKGSLRAVAHEYSPWVTDCFHQRNCSERGIEFELLDRALRILGYRSITYIKAQSFSSRFEMLRNGSADISINEVTIQDAAEELNDSLAMTTTVCQDKLIYWVKDAIASNSSVIFSVCDWKMWLLLAVLVTAVISLRVTYKVNHVVENMGLHVSHFTTKGTSYVWWLILGIFLGVYANLLAVALSFPPKAPSPFKDLEDLSFKLHSGKCRIVVVGAESDIPPGGGVLATVVPNNMSIVPPGIKKRLLEAYRTNPPKFVNNPDEMMKDIQSNDCYIGIDYSLGHPLMLAKYCGIKWIHDEHSVKESFVIVYRKALLDTLGKELEAFLTVASSHDLYARTVTRTAMRQAIGCQAEETKHPLYMGELYEIFSMLIVGATVAILICITEKVVYNYRLKEGQEKGNDKMIDNDYNMSVHKFYMDEHFMW